MSENLDTKNRLINSNPGKLLRIALGVTALYALNHEATNIMGFNPWLVGPAAIAQEYVPPVDRAIVTGNNQVITYANQIKTSSTSAGTTEQLPQITQSPAIQAAEK
ncbi:MAG: hypothetical protein ABSB12_00120 [Candidatus Saccharimonadales bacterium]|jgi:hypothetical protein